MPFLGKILTQIKPIHANNVLKISGSVTRVSDGLLQISGLERFVRLGDQVTVGTTRHDHSAEVISVGPDAVSAVPYNQFLKPAIGDAVYYVGPMVMRPHPSWKGRVLNALGHAIDEFGPLEQGHLSVSVDRASPKPLRRGLIQHGICTGVKAIDLFTPICAGQRIGIFAGSGVGKSTLLAMLARTAGPTVVVVALVGERGREVREFLESTLGATRRTAIAVVATADESTIMRRLAPRTAMTIAEFFRDRGEHVLLIVDSLTRFAHSQREYALAAGEPPVARGYPPSVFRNLAGLLERGGPGESDNGTITMMSTVLVDGDDHNDPIADSVRGIVDGHIVLDRAIGVAGRWPAIDLLSSVSRSADRAWNAEQIVLVRRARELIALFEQTKDLRAIGDYRQGTNAQIDLAVAVVPQILDAIKQHYSEPLETDCFRHLRNILRPPE